MWLGEFRFDLFSLGEVRVHFRLREVSKGKFR